MKGYEYIPQEILERMVFKEPKDSEAELGLQLVSIVPLPCEDCQQQLETTRTVEIRRVQIPYPHTQRKCSGCKLYQHPYTQEFSLTNQELRAIYHQENKKKTK